jgi:CO/xanthine dehydrogenase Mo-binding subunit
VETKGDQDAKLPWASCGIVECLQEGAKAIGWKQKWHKPGTKITGSKAHGIGMAAHACGHGSMSAPMSAVVRLDRDGSLDMNNGLTEIGGGQSTAMMMIAAETVGTTFEQAFPAWGDSGYTPDTGGTFGSRGTPSAGSATLNAGLDLKYQILQEAVKPRGAQRKPLIDAKAEDLDTGDGFVFLKSDPSKKVPLADVANATGSPMIGRGTHVVPPGYSQSVYAAGFAEVEVDTDTGEVTILRYVATDDLGKVINLLGAEQQIEGGVSMSIGFALAEEMKFDGPNNFPVNATWENYAMPTALEHPKWADFQPFAIESISKIGPYGAKGLGEPPTCPPAPAIANAVYNAIGVRIHDAPISRDKVLAGVAQVKRG